MKDLTVRLDDRPGALAELGEALGGAGVSIEGGGAFACGGGSAIAHFLVADGEAARRALAAAGIELLACRDIVGVRLDQERPGQLGALTRRMAEAAVNLEALYSDHAQRLILVVDDRRSAERVAAEWRRDGEGRQGLRVASSDDRRAAIAADRRPEKTARRGGREANRRRGGG